VLTAAESGDIDAFRARLRERLAAGEVDADEAQDIAERFTERQIETAEGPRGQRGLEGIQSCAARFDGALARRARGKDELAARAAMVRAEAGQLEPLAYARYVTHKEPHWRALGVRTLTLPEPEPSDEVLGHAGRWRRKLMIDNYAEVRRAALRAAAQAGDRRDGRAVLEAARLDPDPQARLAAIAAAGAIGTREVVLALGDLWQRAEEEERLAIVAAWKTSYKKSEAPCAGSERAQGPCIAHERLANVSQTDKGMAAVAASLALLEVTPDKADAQAGIASSVIERLIDEAPSRVRVAAIVSAPLSWPSLLEAIVDASKTSDERVQAAAFGRMTELGGKERTRALKALRKLARGEGESAEEARRALVAARDASVVPLLSGEARAKSAFSRGRAAERYAKLGAVDKALALLGDQDAHVRSRAACALVEMED
jgi:hypothetical protein